MKYSLLFLERTFKTLLKREAFFVATAAYPAFSARYLEVLGVVFRKALVTWRANIRQLQLAVALTLHGGAAKLALVQWRLLWRGRKGMFLKQEGGWGTGKDLFVLTAVLTCSTTGVDPTESRIIESLFGRCQAYNSYGIAPLLSNNIIH